MFCEEAPFSAYVAGLNEAYIERRREVRRSPMADTAPCALCAGAGVIVERVTFARFDSPSVALLTSKNVPITAHRVFECVACAGFGVDSQKLLELLSV